MTIPTPKMLIFDYGGTLAHEPKTDSLRGYEALFKHVTHNPRGITAAEFNAFATPLFHVMWEKRHMGYEHHEWQFMRFTLEYMQLELGISIEEAERVFWDNAAAADCWYCGDSIRADLEGSHSAGLFPVWHDSDVYPSPWRDKEKELAPSFPHLHISNWLEILELL